MPKFVSLFKWTEKGIAAVEKSPDRFEAAKSAAQKVGARIDTCLWTVGPYDGVLVLDAPDDETASAFMLGVGKLGNINTTTMRAFDAAEFRKVLGKIK